MSELTALRKLADAVRHHLDSWDEGLWPGPEALREAWLQWGYAVMLRRDVQRKSDVPPRPSPYQPNETVMGHFRDRQPVVRMAWWERVIRFLLKR